MNENCTHCQKNPGTGTDLLCDECRDTLPDWFCQGCHRVVNGVCENCGTKFDDDPPPN